MTGPLAEPLGLADLPGPLRARIEAELAQGERLLWASQPDPNGKRGWRRSLASAGVWLAVWIVLGLTSLLGMFFLPPWFQSGIGLFVVALIASGCGVALLLPYLFSLLASEAAWSSRVRLDLYALTDRRALIWSPAARSGAVAVQQFVPGTIRAERIERAEYADGSGDLTFEPATGGYEQDGFYAVADVRRVDELFRRVLVEPAPWPKPAAIPDLDDFEEPF